jgi:outer membrane protein assembly factor BamE (lipoprotein component of BamABCDE complex)
VRPGTSEQQVSEILGKPARVMRIDGSVVWYYLYADFGRGSVFFDASGKVSGLQQPSAGWSW